MKAISLWQPWASAMAVGSKRIETRGWATDYRGLVAIHAAKRVHKGEMASFHGSFLWRGALSPVGSFASGGPALWDLLPFGAVIAVGSLVDCVPTDEVLPEDRFWSRRPPNVESDLLDWREDDLGDFSPGRFAWMFEDLHPLAVPVPFRGRQRLFNVPDALLREFAYCGADGGICFGPDLPEGALPIMEGLCHEVRTTVAIHAAHAYDNKTLLVPGVAEAANQMEGVDALIRFREVCHA